MGARAFLTFALAGAMWLLPFQAFGQAESDQIQKVQELYESGNYQEALAVAKEHLADTQNKHGESDRATADALAWIAAILDAEGRHREAEEFYERALASFEAALGPSDPAVAEALTTLAGFYTWQSRFAEAEPLYERSVKIIESAAGPSDPTIAPVLVSLANVYLAFGRRSEAEPLLTRATRIFEAAGDTGPEAIACLEGLGGLYRARGRLAKAESVFKKVLSIKESKLDPQDPDVNTTVADLAEMYLWADDLSKAAPFIARLQVDLERGGLPDYNASNSLNQLIRNSIKQEQWPIAAEYWIKLVEIEKRLLRENSSEFGSAQSETLDRIDRYVEVLGIIKDAREISAHIGDRILQARLTDQTFLLAQLAEISEAASALSMMSSRASAGSDKLGILLRKRQDLILSKHATTEMLLPRSASRRVQNASDKMMIPKRLAKINAELTKIDDALAVEFPKYSDLFSSDALSIKDVQPFIGEREALVLFVTNPYRFRRPTEGRLFVWVVARNDSRWAEVKLNTSWAEGTNDLQIKIDSLRCGLDPSNWRDDGKLDESTDDAKATKPAQLSRYQRCKNLLGKDVSKGMALPFDVNTAHDVYKLLFEPVRDLIKDKHLLLVPSGPLTALPFQVLVTSPPAGDDYGLAGWLIRDHALTVLPSVASLAALRRNAKPSMAARPYAAFANPLLEGRGTDVDKSRAALSAAKRDCAAVAELRDIAAMSQTFAASAVPMLGGAAHVSSLRKLEPVPLTADLACDVAKAVGASDDDIYLGARATETRVKALNASGVLASYAVINFATHGAVAGELKADAEPGLVLTPPKNGTVDDDGYLSASEVAGLKLDADWVVLSACNTAASDGNSAEALSGLARAFFYAGARALLVTHWPVREDAAAMLTSRTFTELKKNPTVGRSEAFRRAMLSLMSDPNRPWAAHPSVWAPFVVVGEGGAQASQ